MKSVVAVIMPMRNAERIAADRQKITDGGVLDILLDHVRDQKELTPSQISTAFGLLKKILPDFSTSAPTTSKTSPASRSAAAHTRSAAARVQPGSARAYSLTMWRAAASNSGMAELAGDTRVASP